MNYSHKGSDGLDRHDEVMKAVFLFNIMIDSFVVKKHRAIMTRSPHQSN